MSDRAAAPERFRCPTCGGAVRVPAPGDTSAVCAACATAVAVENGIVILTAPADDRDYPKDLIELVTAVEDRHFWFAARNDVIVSALRRVPGDLRNKHALDIGCGRGFVAAALERAGLVVSGADMHLSALRRARTRMRGAVVASRATTLPFFADFDVAALFDVIEHVDDDVAVLDHARQMLLPGGHVVVTVPAGPELWTAYDDVIGHKRRYDRAMLVAALQRAQFALRHVSYFNFAVVLAGMRQRQTRAAQAVSDRGAIVRRALTVPPGPLNTLLRWSVKAESPFRRFSWLRGGSLIAVAQRSN